MDLGKLTDEQKKGLGEPNARFLTAKEKIGLFRLMSKVILNSGGQSATSANTRCDNERSIQKSK